MSNDNQYSTEETKSEPKPTEMPDVEQMYNTLKKLKKHEC